jgi:hypothetical protein
VQLLKQVKSVVLRVRVVHHNVVEVRPRYVIHLELPQLRS